MIALEFSASPVFFTMQVVYIHCVFGLREAAGAADHAHRKLEGGCCGAWPSVG